MWEFKKFIEVSSFEFSTFFCKFKCLVKVMFHKLKAYIFEKDLLEKRRRIIEPFEYGQDLTDSLDSHPKNNPFLFLNYPANLFSLNPS